MWWYSRRAVFALLAVLSLAGAWLLSGGPLTAADPGRPPLKGLFADDFIVMDPPVPAPQRAFSDLSGRPLTLADYRGKLVLINFWATWCAPCVKELPSLDRLQANLGNRGLVVLAVSIDRGGTRQVVPFLERLDLRHLEAVLDSKSVLFRALGGGRAVPATYLMDAEGRIVGAMEGAAEWDGPDAKALIEHYLAPQAPEFLKTDG